MTAADGVGRVFAFARRTDHDRGLTTLSPSANYPVRRRSSASYICGTCAVPTANSVIFLLLAVAHERNSVSKSQEAQDVASGLLSRWTNAVLNVLKAALGWKSSKRG